jgi:hypothetical protein
MSPPPPPQFCLKRHDSGGAEFEIEDWKAKVAISAFPLKSPISTLNFLVQSPTMSNSELPKDEAITSRVEGGVRKFFERLGGALDFALRRPLNPQPRTDVTALIPPLERAIDDKLRHEGNKVIAPNLIELRYDYETYQQLTNKRIEFLERELRLSVYEYIHNRRYTTLGDVQVKIAYDMFTRKLTITARFSDEAPKPVSASSTPDAPALPAARTRLTLKSPRHELRTTITSGTRVGLGRTHDNALVIEDSTVSSVHAAFTLAANGTLYVTDLGSSNGTFVNGVQIVMGDKTIVKAGDTLRFGEVELSLECSE